MLLAYRIAAWTIGRSTAIRVASTTRSAATMVTNMVTALKP